MAESSTVLFLDEESGASEAVSQEPSGFLRSLANYSSWGLMGALAGLFLGCTIFTLVILLNNTTSYSNHALLDDIHNLYRELHRAERNITQLQSLLDCIQCINATLLITNIHTNGTIVVYNATNGTYFELVTYTIDLGETVGEQGAQITLLDEIVGDLVGNNTVERDSFRLEITDFVPLPGIYPNTTFVPFEDQGVFAYNFNESGVFDTSNDTYVLVKKDVLVSASFGIYYVANGTDPNLICMLFPFLNSSIFMSPPLVGAGNQALNLTAIGFPFDHAGTVNGAGQFEALQGMELNVQCTSGEPQPFALSPSTFFAMRVNSLIV